MYHYSYGLFRKVAIYKCTCVCKCWSLSIYFQSYNSFPPVSIYCAYCLFMYVQFSCCALRALNWSINWIELNWIELYSLKCKNCRTKFWSTSIQFQTKKYLNCIYSKKGRMMLCRFFFFNFQFLLPLTCLYSLAVMKVSEINTVVRFGLVGYLNRGGHYNTYAPPGPDIHG